MKKITSLPSGPTAMTSAQPAMRKVTINEDEEVFVGEDTREDYYLHGFAQVADSVFKCADCKTGTIHQGIEMSARNLDGTAILNRRIYLCTNCGKYSSK